VDQAAEDGVEVDFHRYIMNTPYFGSSNGAVSDFTWDVGSKLPVVLDGVVVSSPNIDQGAIPGGQAQIFGNFTEQQATQLGPPGAHRGVPDRAHGATRHAPAQLHRDVPGEWNEPEKEAPAEAVRKTPGLEQKGLETWGETHATGQ